jgi:hypothetical protein
MSEIDDQVADMMRAAALAHAPDLVEVTYSDQAFIVRVHEDRPGGIAVWGVGRRKAWTKALEAAERRTAWRLRLIERRVERARSEIMAAKGDRGPTGPGDTPPDGAA